MKSISTLSALTGFAVFASAAAVALPADVEKRANTGVYLCNDRGFTGYFPLAADLNDKVSSVGPDEGSFCYFFVNPNCDANGDFFHVESPGVRDLSQTPVNGPAGSTRNFEDKLSSYLCSI